MFIEINGNSKELRFDLNFIRHMNETFKAEVAGGLMMPMGIALASNQLNRGDYSALSDVVRCALNKSFSKETVDGIIIKYAEEEKADELLEEVKTEMGKSILVKKQLKRAEELSQQ